MQEHIEFINKFIPTDKWQVKYTDKKKNFYYKNLISGKVQWNVPIELPSPWTAHYSQIKKKFFYKNSNTGEKIWKIPGNNIKCNSIQGLSWTGNSCYLDSSILGFFSVPNSFTDSILKDPLSIQNNILTCGKTPEEDLKNRRRVQEQLNIVVDYIRGIGEQNTCVNLRKTLQNCPNPERYHDDKMKDAGEFLTYLLSLFPQTNTAIKTTSTYATNDDTLNFSEMINTSNITDDKASIIQFIDSFSLLQDYSDDITTKDLLTKIDTVEFDEENMFTVNGQKFKRKVSRTVIDYSPYIIFRIDRNHPIEGFIDKKIIPLEVIDNFKLSSIVVFKKKHYTCYFRCDDNWYYYDDLREGEIEFIGSYENMLEKEPNPTKKGTLYFYN